MVCATTIFRYSTDKESTRCSAFSRTPHAFLSACSSASSCALYAWPEPGRRATTGKSAPQNSAREPRRSCRCCREQRGGMLEGLERGNKESGSHPGAHYPHSHAEKKCRYQRQANNRTQQPARSRSIAQALKTMRVQHRLPHVTAFAPRACRDFASPVR